MLYIYIIRYIQNVIKILQNSYFIEIVEKIIFLKKERKIRIILSI